MYACKDAQGTHAKQSTSGMSVVAEAGYAKLLISLQQSVIPCWPWDTAGRSEGGTLSWWWLPAGRLQRRQCSAATARSC